ncbi:uncharacterized protein LOC112680110, partial [Sipha flava]|uniref:Uncharacterized protein LOC112680110 n=1 Tax=Sipha flava TaxID=143950 RepID=A0A8B8F509_9HEMI
LNENSKIYYESISKLKKSTSSTNEMKMNSENEKSLNENLESYSYEYQLTSKKPTSSIDQMNIYSDQENSLNDNLENYSYEYKSESQKSISSINEITVNSDEEKNLSENLENYSYEYKSKLQKSISAINEITINSDKYYEHIDLETVRPNAKISSHTTIKNYYPMIQENSEVELYLDELQTSKMQKSSTDSMESNTRKSDWSWTANDRSKTGAREHRVQADLKKLLLDLTTGYLREGASDLVDYGIEFFNRLKKCRAAGPGGCTGERAHGGDDHKARPERNGCGQQVLSSGSVDDDDGGPVRTFAKSAEVRR